MSINFLSWREQLGKKSKTLACIILIIMLLIVLILFTLWHLHLINKMELENKALVRLHQQNSAKAISPKPSYPANENEISPNLIIYQQNTINENQLTLDVSDMAIRDLLQLLAQRNNINMMISDSVKGNITLHLHNTNWQNALNSLLDMQGLSCHRQNGVLLIAPLADFITRDQQNLQIMDLTSLLIKLHYAKAADMILLIQNKSNELLSTKGSAGFDARTNTIWVRDLPQKIVNIQNLIQKLDKPESQVLINTRIVNVDESHVRELGIRLNTQASINSTQEDFNVFHRDGPLTAQSNRRFNIAVVSLGDHNLLDLELAALENEGHAKIISSPRLITGNRQSATIESGQEIPYQEKTSGGATSVAFKKAVLSLKVTPEISNEDTIMLNLVINQDKMSAIQVNGVPAINTQEIQTQVRVHNNQTLVLGGIYEQIHHNNCDKIPLLARIPIIGKLFHHSTLNTQRSQLLIFVTPTILPIDS